MNLQRIAKILENKNELIINEVVLDTAQKNKQIIYGAKAYNVQSPTNLRKQTVDYDVLTKKPKKFATETAETLRRRLGKDVTVVKGSHKGTYRVKLNNETIVDYTQIKGKIDTKNSWGNDYRSLKSIKRNATRLSNNPKLAYRRKKDLDTLEKIRKIQRLNTFDF